MNNVDIENILPEPLAKHSDVRKFYAASVKGDLATLNGIASQCASLVRQVRADVKKVGTNTDLRMEAISQKQKEINQASLVQLDAIQADFEQSAERLGAALHAAMVLSLGDDSDTNKAVLTELRVQAAWARIVRQLDTASNLFETLKRICGEIVAARDYDALRAVDREMTAYLISRGQGQLAGVFTELISPLFSEVQNAAAQLLTLLETGKSLLSASLDYTRREFKGEGSVTRLFGFFRGEQFSPVDTKFDMQQSA
jgi:hypothetical protein